MAKSIEDRLVQLEKEVAAIKRLRLIKVNLTAQEAEDAVNKELLKPSKDK